MPTCAPPACGNELTCVMHGGGGGGAEPVPTCGSGVGLQLEPRDWLTMSRDPESGTRRLPTSWERQAPSGWPLAVTWLWTGSRRAAASRWRAGRQRAVVASAMDAWVRFAAVSQGRERVFRAAQYASALLAYTLQRGGASLELVKRLKQLEAHLSLGRKLFRLGNSAEALEAAKRAVHLSDLVLRFCITVGHLNRAMYLGCDNLLWAAKVGLVPTLDQGKWSQRSFRYYLFALIMNLSRDAYELSVLAEREARSCGKADGAEESAKAAGTLVGRARARLRLLCRVLRANPPLLLDVLKNCCDIIIPLDRLGLLKTSPGVVAFCGLSSSILCIVAISQPWLKLKP